MKTQEQENFKEKLKRKMNDYVHYIYRITKKFPKEESYGSISQIRRATMSIVLNYVEGFARRRPAVQLNFLEISYGSLKESKYLLNFAKEEGWIDEGESIKGINMTEEIGAMLWTEIMQLERRA